MGDGWWTLMRFIANGVGSYKKDTLKGIRDEQTHG
jgi:hypothetical protein